MKKLIIALLFTSFLFTACNTPETYNVSKVTYYPTITLNGEDTVFVPLGTTFEDPGAVALAGEDEIPTIISYEGLYRGGTTLDTNIADEYIQTYTATNSDGFKASASRKIIVYKTGDLVNSIEGVYISTVRRNGSLLNPSQGSSVNMKYIYIWKNSDGSFEISDAFGGWYSIGRNFGVPGITSGGIIEAVNIPSNNFNFLGNPMENDYFGDPANITSLTVDPDTKQVVLTCTWDTSSFYTFVSTLTQEQL